MAALAQWRRDRLDALGYRIMSAEPGAWRVWYNWAGRYEPGEYPTEVAAYIVVIARETGKHLEAKECWQ